MKQIIFLSTKGAESAAADGGVSYKDSGQSLVPAAFESALSLTALSLTAPPFLPAHGLEEKIIQLNPLLEAWGNAQTLMNDNSSRFGKFVELRFDERHSIQGAIMSDYLLEKSRVVDQVSCVGRGRVSAVCKSNPFFEPFLPTLA